MLLTLCHYTSLKYLHIKLLFYFVEERQINHSEKQLKAKSSSSSKSHKKQSGVDKFDRHDKDVGVPEDKSNLLDKFTDLLTDDVKLTEQT